MPILFMGLLALFTLIAIVVMCLLAVWGESRELTRVASAPASIPPSPEPPPLRAMAKAAGQAR